MLIGSERRGSLVVFEAGVNVEEDGGRGGNTCDSDSPREEIATRYSGPSLITTNLWVRVAKLL